MRLIGMLDSPYVRRVAISLDLLGVEFTHESISVFKDFERFKSINSVVKAPSLVCDDGEVLMDSSLILQFFEATQPATNSLWSRDSRELQHEIRAVSLALAACDKSVQLIYERNLRPEELHYESWTSRVTGQILAAFSALEHEVKIRATLFQNQQSQAAITAAVAWSFAQAMLSAVIPAGSHPYLAKLSIDMESTPAFRRYPPQGPGVPPI
jgi:glutathione S-transferase